MTAAAAKRRLTHYLAVTAGSPHRDAEFALQSMTPKERGILGKKALKWRQENNKYTNPEKSPSHDHHTETDDA